MTAAGRRFFFGCDQSIFSASAGRSTRAACCPQLWRNHGSNGDEMPAVRRPPQPCAIANNKRAFRSINHRHSWPVPCRRRRGGPQEVRRTHGIRGARRPLIPCPGPGLKSARGMSRGDASEQCRPLTRVDADQDRRFSATTTISSARSRPPMRYASFENIVAIASEDRTNFSVPPSNRSRG